MANIRLLLGLNRQGRGRRVVLRYQHSRSSLLSGFGRGVVAAACPLTFECTGSNLQLDPAVGTNEAVMYRKCCKADSELSATSNRRNSHA